MITEKVAFRDGSNGLHCIIRDTTGYRIYRFRQKAIEGTIEPS